MTAFSEKGDLNISPLVESRLYKSAPIVTGLIFFLITMILAGLFWFQLKAGFDNEVRFLSSKLRQHNQLVEFAIRNSLEHLDSLQMLVADEDEVKSRAGIPSQDAKAHWPKFTVYESSGRHFFSLDKASDFDLTGNIVGEGSLKNRSPEFYEDMEQALMINAGFRSMIYTLPNASRARFLASEKFIVASPWRPSPEIGFNELMYSDPTWEMASRKNNPEREKRWSKTYFGGKDVGLLVPVASPVYRDERLVGVLAIDNSLDYLNRLYKSFEYSIGSLMLVDESGDVIAHPASYANPLKVEEAPKFKKLLPSGINEFDLMKFKYDEAEFFNGHVVFKHAFIGAPWSQYYIVSENELWIEVLKENSAQMILSFVFMIASLFLIYFWNAFRLVGFVKGFVHHLGLNLNRKSKSMPLDPAKWGDWFDETSVSFRDSINSIVSDKESHVAGVMNDVMDAKEWPRHTRYEMWGAIRRSTSASPGLYDHFAVGGDSAALILADINGKGIQSSLFGIIAKTLFRVTRLQTVSASISKINTDLYRNRESDVTANFFCTLFNSSTGRFTCCNGDYPNPMKIGIHGNIDILELGMNPILCEQEEFRFQCDELDLDIGDTVLFYNRGMLRTMAENSTKDPVELIVKLFEGRDTTSAQEAVERVTSLIDKLNDGKPLKEDIVCVALSYKPQRS